MEYKKYKIFSQMARKKEKADKVLKNAKILNVFTEEIIEADLAISENVINPITHVSAKRQKQSDTKNIIKFSIPDGVSECIERRNLPYVPASFHAAPFPAH